MEKIVKKMKSRKTAAILRLQSEAMMSIHNSLHSAGAVQMMPVSLSPITDPLCHSVFDARISYYGQELSLTKSMIMHKQISMISPHLDKIYIVSPNVRLEKAELAASKRHLIDFSQVDMEFKRAGGKDFMAFTEGMVKKAVQRVRKECSGELAFLGRELSVPKGPFKAYDSGEAEAEFGPSYEQVLSLDSAEPFWITNLKREFYDREDPDEPGKYLNYDLVYPEGFGEALSGGEREWEYLVLLRKFRERKQSPSSFAPYVELAKRGELRPSAGGGLGVERLVRYLSGAEDICDVSPFAKRPGEAVVL